MDLPRQSGNESDGEGEDQCQPQRSGETCECQFNFDMATIHGADEQREQPRQDNGSTEEESPHDVKPEQKVAIDQ